MSDEKTLIQIVADYNSGDEVLRASSIERMYKEVDGFIGYMVDKHYSAFKSKYYWDLYEEGLLAVVESMGKFDPTRGTITTYFTPYIKHAMSAFTNSLTNRSTQYYSNIMNQIREALKHFEELQITPAATDIAYYTGLSVKKVEDGLSRINATNECGYESEAELDVMVGKSTEGPERSVIEKERADTLHDAIDRLDEEDRAAFLCYFGADDDMQKSFLQVGKALGISSATAMERVNRALRILRSDKELQSLEGISMGNKKASVLSKNRTSFVPDHTDDDIYDGLIEININIGKRE